MKILIIDDEQVFRGTTAERLCERDFECRTAGSGEQGLEVAVDFVPDVVVCDINLPGMNGEEVLARLQEIVPEASALMVTAFGTLVNAIESFRRGAVDYLLKPLHFEELLVKLERIRWEKELLAEVTRLRRAVTGLDTKGESIGNSGAMCFVRERIKAVAPFDNPVLLLGESGTGKELAARAIHEQSGRKDGPFIAVNCTAIPEALAEAQFFGHLPGTFTGATGERIGLIEAAEGGTLFLDEIADMSLTVQPKLLRAMETSEFVPLGATTPKASNFRLISATHQNPGQAIKEGALRQDLYYRLRGVEIVLPSLREHREDIPILINEFIKESNLRMKKQIQGVTNESMRALMLYDWPGNIRQLKSAIENAMVFSVDRYLTLEDFTPELHSHKSQPVPDRLSDALKAYEQAHILNVLERSGGDKEEAAVRLGIHRATLYRRIAEFGDEFEEA